MSSRSRRWRDVRFLDHKLIVSRTLSANVEADSPNGGRFREVPLPDQAAAALDRLSRRPDYVGPDEYVFCNRFGRRLDPSALRRRYERARDAAELPPLRFHPLRHTYGSLLVAGGIDLVSVKSAMGHANMSTTERYLYARPATELAKRFTRALLGTIRDQAHAENSVPAGIDRPGTPPPILLVRQQRRTGRAASVAMFAQSRPPADADSREGSR